MNIPDYATTTEFMQWARENKRRADRLLAAAKAVVLDHDWDWSAPASNHVIELRNAATDYEDTRG